MIITNNNQRYYDGFKINSAFRDEKTTFKYDLNKQYLEKIVAILNQGKHTMLQPKVAHFTIFIKDTFDCKTLAPRLRREFGSENMLFAYSLEKANKLHVHLMLILETKHYNPDTVFYHKALSAILALKDVEGCDLNSRLHWEKKTAHKYCHSLKVDYEFRDAIERYSYLAKKNDKTKLPAEFKKTFATSQIKHNKYYAILGAENMIKIKQIHKNEKLQFCDDNAILDKRYFNFRKTVNDEDDIKSMYHFVDTKTNETIGFYGYSYCADIDSEHYILTISIDDLYIDSSYSSRGVFSDYFEVLYLHLRDEMRNVLGQVKGDLKDQQKLMINSLAYESPALEELLSMVVSSAAEEHSLTISQPEVWMITS